ncbi:MAG: hypothetical protein AAGG55_07785 [Pseudomonadota bacterium]
MRRWEQVGTLFADTGQACTTLCALTLTDASFEVETQQTMVGDSASDTAVQLSKAIGLSGL